MDTVRIKRRDVVKGQCFRYVTSPRKGVTFDVPQIERVSDAAVSLTGPWRTTYAQYVNDEWLDCEVELLHRPRGIARPLHRRCTSTRTTRSGSSMAKLGIYRHFKGGLYRVLHNAVLCSTDPVLDRTPTIVYISLETGEVDARTEDEFNDLMPPERVGGEADVHRFTWAGDQVVKIGDSRMGDAEAGALYDDLLMSFTGRKAAPDPVKP